MTAPFAPAAIDHVVLRAASAEALISFYVDVVGCAVEKVQEKFGLTQLRAGASLIDVIDVSGPLGQMGGAAPTDGGRNMDHFCLRIEPWDETVIRAHLDAHGVDASETGMRYGAEGSGPSIYISDPEGNTVELKGPPVS